ncbi:MAG: DUF6174 domain-containing protein [Conexibacter sp.]
MTKSILIAALAALLLPAGLASAGSDPGSEPDVRIVDGSAQRELDAARAAWHAFGPRHYRLRIATDCFCAEEVRRPRRIEVLGGRPVERPPAHLRRYATVRRLFARVQEAIDAEVAGLTAEYDRHGLPRTIFVDVSHNIADEEHGVRIVAFRVLD